MYCNWLSRKEGFQEVYTEDGKIIVPETGKNVPQKNKPTVSSTPTTTTSTTVSPLLLPSSNTILKPTKQLHPTGNGAIPSNILASLEGYRLPTDFEWEYAAKGGPSPGMFQYIGGDNVDEVAWYKDNTGLSSRPVGLKRPNELGIYDLAGNVYEYCTDGHPVEIRVVRGGGWSSRKESMRASYKNGCRLDEAHAYVGFRVARSGPSPVN